MAIARCIRIPVVSIILLICSLQSLAQTNPNLETGFTPFSSHWNERFDSIDNVTGALTVDIPLGSYRQRGGNLGLQFGLHFRNPSFYQETTCSPCFTQWLSIGGGFQVVDRDDLQVQEAWKSNLGNAYWDYTVYSPDGSSHPLGNTNGTQYRSTDTTGLFFDTSTSLLTDSRGIRYQQYTRSAPGGCFDGNAKKNDGYLEACDATLREDPNGNRISFSPTSGWTDTLGRLIPVPLATQDFSGCTGTQYYAISSATLWNLPGPNGSTTPIKFCYATINIDYPSKSSFLGYHGTPSMLQSVVLPDGTTWTFQYSADGFGQLAAMTLPTGATISYGYVADQPCTYSGGTSYPFSGHQRVATRTVNMNDGTAAVVWNYSYVLAQPPSASTQTTITDPLGNAEVHLASGFGGGCTLYETQATWYQGSPSTGKLLKTEGKSYSYSTTPYTGSVSGTPGIFGNVFLTQVDTTVDSKRKTVKYVPDAGFTYNAGDPGDHTVYNALYGKKTQVAEYDYGTNVTGSLLRQTVTTYLWQTNSSYLLYNLLDLASAVTVSDGAGIQAANTSYGYDGSALAASGISTQHNASPANGSFRGNLTSTQRWLNSGTLTCPDASSGGAASNVISSITYFDTGTINTSADPCHNATTYSYSANAVGAYPTHVTNALNQPTDYTYDFNTGLRTSSQDENRLTTSYSYDSVWRIAQVNYPDGGVDVFTRHDSPPFTTTQTKKMNGTQNIVTANVFDGLGRVTQSQITSDPQGTIYTDTTYDALGRVVTVTNPHRVAGDATSSPGTTTYSYDALGRKTAVTYPDNSVLTTAYCGGSTLVTDPVSKWRRSRTDGLGRLVEVDEPNSTSATVVATGCPGIGEPIWVTRYTYDTLGNLTNIVQNGSRQRTFTYDSLSRLLTSSNPETGLITYTYSPDGLVLTKNDARNVTVTSTYDALHREKTRTYSNGDPSVTINYDEPGCLGLAACSNIGQRTSMTDAAGSESWAYQLDAANLRTIHKEQRTTSSITKSATYYLDLAGNLTSVVYPTGRTVNYAYDSAGRPSTAADSANGITYATAPATPSAGCLAGAVCYTPQGSVYSMSIGQSASFTGLNVAETFNNRLQPTEIKASSTGGNAMDLTYSFVDPATTKNAGHVYGITNNLDSTRSQTFSYDQLNRITAGQTNSTFATSPGHCWGESYSVDAWGNLQAVAATTNTSYTGCTQESGFTKTADASNHLSGFSYDLSGNTANDGTYTYVWDGESQLKSAGGVTYTYDGDGRRASKSSGKLYWYGSGGEILAETDAAGNATAEYIFFGGKRIAMLPVGSSAQFYAEDFLGSSRVVTSNTGVVCYDADFYPYGGERTLTNTCTQNAYKFEGKERDAETGNDDFGARYYSNRFGRWLSADWSAIPVAVPYANLTNPQSLNLYSMVADDPESFADLDGHEFESAHQAASVTSIGGGLSDELPRTQRPEYDVPHCICAVEPQGQSSGQSTPQEQKKSAGTPAPTNPDGTPTKPPIPPPPGADGKPNDWVRVPGTQGRPDKWVPRDPVPSPKGGQPGASWDDKNGHWDIDDGNRNRNRYLPDGTKVDHFNKPIPIVPIVKAATVATVIYWIVSEGSRILFPPRNFIPVP